MTQLSRGLGKPNLYVIIFQGYFGPFEFLDFFSQTEAKEEHGEFHKRKQGQFPKKGMIFIKKENNNKKW